MTKRISQFMLAALALLILTATVRAASPPFSAILKGSQEVPSNASTAIGNGYVLLNSAENMITVSLKFNGLSSAQTMAHIHGPAGVGETGPVLFDIGSSGTTSGSFINLTFAVTPQQVGYLRAGLLYFNVHSASFPNGEIRGQIQPVRNGKIAFVQCESDTSVNIYLMNGDGGGLTKLTGEMANNEVAPVWSPDGSRVAYFQQGRINAVNADGSGKTLIKSGVVGLKFDWSPDGTKIVFDQSAHLYTVSTDGLQTVTQLTNVPDTRDFSPNWSQDGSKIVFVSYRNDSQVLNIYAMNSDGTGQVQLTFFPNVANSPDFPENPVWSPDGSKIAYNNRGQVFVMNADGTNQIQLTNAAIQHSAPTWSPDGTRILFYRHISYVGYPTPASIYSIKPDGTGLTFLRSVSLGVVMQFPTAPTVQPLFRQRLNRVSDFDGDGATDLAAWRPSDGIWRIVNSFDGTTRNQEWGAGALGDVLVPGDYDGDGRIDLAVFRAGEGNWYIVNSFDSSLSLRGWGQSGDVPVPGDYDGDGKTDVAVFRPSDGNWYIVNSSTGSATFQNWGISTDKPVPADYDGDNRTDLAVFRPADGVWYIIRSGGGVTVQGWGQSTDKTVPADYDGDRKADIAVYRPEEGNWYIRHSAGGVTVRGWGESTDRPAPADYDGDGKADLTIWRPTEGTWYIIASATNTVRLGFLGSSGDVLVPAAYIP